MILIKFVMIYLLIYLLTVFIQNPLTKENLLKMQDDLESNQAANEKINTIAYGCTSGTIAIGEDKVKELILFTKGCYFLMCLCIKSI